MIVKKIKNEYRVFKFGLTCLMTLKEILLNNEQPISDIMNLLSIKEGDITDGEALIVEIFKDAFNKDKVKDIYTLVDIKNFLSEVDFPQQLSFLLSSLSGKVSITPSELYSLTPYELENIYKGYLDQLELLSNCIQIATFRGNHNITEKFSLKSANVNISTKEERDKTFSNLNI